MLGFDELLRINECLTRQDVHRGEFSLKGLPVSVVSCLLRDGTLARRCVVWVLLLLCGHERCIADLIANIAGLSTSITATQGEFEDLLYRCLTQGVSKTILALLELFALDRVLVICCTLLHGLY